MSVQRHYTAITTTAVVSTMACVLPRLDGDLKSSPPGYVRMLQAVTVKGFNIPRNALHATTVNNTKP